MNIPNKVKKPVALTTAFLTGLLTYNALTRPVYASDGCSRKAQTEQTGSSDLEGRVSNSVGLKEPDSQFYDLVDRTVKLYKEKGWPMDVGKEETAKEYLDLFEERLTSLKGHDLMALDDASKKSLSSAYDELGLSYKMYRKDIEKAKQMYNLSLQLNPNNITTLINLGYLYFKNEKNYQNSLECYKRVLEIEPNNTIAKIYKAKCLKEINK